MSFPASEVLNTCTPGDSYSAACTIETTHIKRVLLDVSNQAIYWQLKRAVAPNTSAGNWEWHETYMIPGSRVITRSGIVGIRIRAAVPAASLPAGATQAVVTVEAVK